MHGYAYSEEIFTQRNRATVESTGLPQDQLLSPRQRLALMSLIGSGNTGENQRLINDSLHMVSNIANRYSDHGVPSFELIGAGNRGLFHALESAQQMSYFQFSSYAARCVRQHIECTILNQNEPE